jgi:hypothetical protein
LKNSSVRPLLAKHAYASMFQSVLSRGVGSIKPTTSRWTLDKAYMRLAASPSCSSRHSSHTLFRHAFTLSHKEKAASWVCCSKAPS